MRIRVLNCASDSWCYRYILVSNKKLETKTEKNIKPNGKG